jgi:hypothetical protein
MDNLYYIMGAMIILLLVGLLWTSIKKSIRRQEMEENLAIILQDKVDEIKQKNEEPDQTPSETRQ